LAFLELEDKNRAEAYQYMQLEIQHYPGSRQLLQQWIDQLQLEAQP